MNFQLSLRQKLDLNNPYLERLKKNPKKNFANIYQVLCVPIAHNVWPLPEVADLATEISQLPKTKIGKKSSQLTQKQQFRVTAVIGRLVNK
jgi:hypothetical protein